MNPPHRPAGELFHADRPSAEQTWKKFVSRDTTLAPNETVRTQWHRGRPRYAVWIARVDDPGIAERVRRVRAVLGDRIRPIADDQLHVTAFVSGFPTEHPRHNDDIGQSVLDRQVEDLRARPPHRLRLVVEGASSFLASAFVRVADPQGDLHALRTQLLAAHPPGHPGEVRFAAYDPHVTVGDYRAACPTAEIAAALGPLRDFEPAPLHIGAVELVDFEAAVPGSPLRTLERFRLRDRGRC